MIQIVVPMAGESSRFLQKGYIPKPFLPLIDGKSIIETIEDHISFLAKKSNTSVNISILLKDEFIKNSVYRSMLSNLKSKLYKVQTPNLGPLATVSQMLDNFQEDDQLIIYDCDQLSIFSLNYLCNKERGVVLTHKHNSPELSYIGRDGFGAINRIVEKEVISEEASCGVYYFPSVGIFKKAALYDFAKNNSLNNEFRIANLYNYLIKSGINVDSYKCGGYFNLGTPADYEWFCKHHIDDYKRYLI